MRNSNHRSKSNKKKRKNLLLKVVNLQKLCEHKRVQHLVTLGRRRRKVKVQLSSEIIV
jgi:hypothetical protein